MPHPNMADTALFAAVFLWGVLAGRFQVFPFSLLRTAWRFAKRLRESLTFKVTGHHQVAPVEQEHVAPLDVMFLGDSLTFAYDWQARFPDLRIDNRGVLGETSEGLLTNLPHLLTLRPRAIVLMIGINDFATIGLRSMSINDVDKTERNYRAILELCQSAGAHVVVNAVLKTNKHLNGVYLQRHVDTLNARLRALASAFACDFIDANEHLSNPEEGLRAQFTYDGVHLTEAAYEVWANELTAVLDAALLQKSG